MQCVELGQLPALHAAAATTQMRHRTSATRIRKRHCRRCQRHQLVAEAAPETDIPATPAVTSRRTTYSSSTGSPKLTLALSATAALAAAAMLHTTYAAASDALALPLHGTATPLHAAAAATQELNSTLALGSSSTSTAAVLHNESRALLDSTDDGGSVEHWFDSVFLVLKAFVMLFIIIAAICGNLLVIISVMRVRKLRCVYLM